MTTQFHEADAGWSSGRKSCHLWIFGLLCGLSAADGSSCWKAWSCLLFGLIYIHQQRPLYTAMVIVAPQGSSLASIQPGSSALQALGSLSGISLGKSGDSLDEFIEKLDTPLVAAEMQARYSMLQKVFSGNWDTANRRWKAPSGTRHWIGGIVNDILGVPQPRDPDIFSLAGYVSQSIKSIKDRNTGFVTLRYSSADPQFSTYFLKALLSTADTSMRAAVKQRAAANVNFLQDKLQTVQSTDLRQALIALLEDVKVFDVGEFGRDVRISVCATADH